MGLSDRWLDLPAVPEFWLRDARVVAGFLVARPPSCDVARAARCFRGTFDKEFAHPSALVAKSHPRNGEAA
jgi:hypothetical protein